jgi:tripartite-type tricarboxylate transporter receptor subunit TctC
LSSSLAGIQLIEVPYRGSGPQMNDLIVGHIDLAVTSTVAVLAHVGTGRARALGVTSSTRAASMADVPTIQEAGLPGFEFTGHYAMYAPPGVSPATRERLYEAVRESIAAPETANRLRTLGADLNSLSPSEFASFLQTEDARWARAAAEGLITAAR